MKIGFDTKLYLKIQKKAIEERIKKFGSKLYLEFGGKLTDDMHAARVLPGFEPDAKLQLLLQFKEKAEVVIVVNANDVIANKVRKDSNLSYQAEVKRYIDIYSSVGLPIAGVAITMYQENDIVKKFARSIKNLGIKVYHHYKIDGYPKDLEKILSDDGLGKNEFIETSKPLVIVTAPGPGSGKMATCLSQLYHSTQDGIKAGYAKYETFPVWNLPLKHPINLAYEAATLELDDVNMIDPFHLEHYKEVTTNYNRDIDTFPLLKAIFKRLYGKSSYYSPTDMGVNMIGFAITNEDVCCDAARKEIVRRHYAALKDVFLGKYENDILAKSELVMNQVGVKLDARVCVKACLDKQAKTKVNTVAIELEDGKIVTGKETKDLSACSSVLINALKTLGGIDDSIYLIQPEVLQAIKNMKLNSYGYESRLSVAETLTCLSIQSLNDKHSAIAIEQLPLLKETQAHASCILKEGELSVLKKIGINVTEQAASYIKALSTK